jgi:hypothetical protein
MKTGNSTRAIPRNRPFIFLAIGRATNHLVISSFFVSLMDGFFQFEHLCRELSGLMGISTELMHFSSVFHRSMPVAKMKLIRHHLFTHFFCCGEFTPAYPRKLLA